MEPIKAKLKYLKIPPRKVRFLADVIRGLPVQEAEAKLMLSPRRPKDALVKLLRSAVANATNNHKLDAGKLFISEIWVDQGPKTKRWTPRARGSASLIEKKTSHITIVLAVLPDAKAKAPRFTIQIKKKAKKEEPKHKHEKKESSEKKPPAEKPKEDKKPEIKSAAKPSAFKKMFQRKSI